MSVSSLGRGLLSLVEGGKLWRPALFLSPRLHVEIGRRLVRQLPADVRLIFQLVVSVRLVDGVVKRGLEGGEVLVLDRFADRRPVLGEELVQCVFVFRPREGA